MSHDEINDEKAQKDVRDTVEQAEETKEDVKDIVEEETKEDVKDIVEQAEETKEDVKDTVADDLGEEKFFTEQAKKLQEKAAEIVQDNKSTGPKSSRIEQESDTKQHNEDRASTEIGKAVFNKVARKPIVTVLVIGAVILVGILLYTLVQYGSNQSEKIENSEMLWNQSLDGLRSGNVSVSEYCNQNPHDQRLCDLYWNLKFM